MGKDTSGREEIYPNPSKKVKIGLHRRPDLKQRFKFPVSELASPRACSRGKLRARTEDVVLNENGMVMVAEEEFSS